MATERIGTRRLLILFCFCLASIPCVYPPAVRAGSALRVTPDALRLTLTAGERSMLSVQLSNDGDQALTPLVYEAAASPPVRSVVNAAPIRVALPVQSERLDPQLVQHGRSSHQQTFIVYLADQADLAGAYRIADWHARGRYVYELLHAHAETTQLAVRELLRARGATFQPLWIVNALVVQGSFADAVAVAGLADVALVRSRHQAALPPADTRSLPGAYRALCSPDQPDNPICWNIRAIGAQRVWNEFGDTGAGIVVASNDSGVAVEHEALAAQYRGYRSPGVYQHAYNWYDPGGINDAPVDDNGHGTHTTSTMVGRGSANLPAVGVAPGAQWIAAQGCSVQSCDEADLIRTAQWLLAPTDPQGRNPRPDLRPMIINNSWAGPGGDDWYAGYTTAWRAAGMFPVFAAGNSPVAEQASCGSISSPADYDGVVAVGATDVSGQVAPFSLLGPALSGQTKPDLVAPGMYASGQFGILGAYRGGRDTYRTLQGTSMAAPHVSGVVALMWSANPALIGDYDATLALLRRSAQRHDDARCGVSLAGANNVYGAGLVDAFAAVALARTDLPWLMLGSAEPLAPGASATVSVTIDTRALPGPGVYRARIQIYAGDLGQLPVSIPVEVTVLDDGRTTPVSGVLRDVVTGAAIQGRIVLDEGWSEFVGENGYAWRLAVGAHTVRASASGYQTRMVAFEVQRQPITLDVTLNRSAPQIEIQDGPLAATLQVGQTLDTNVIIRNTGPMPLHIQASIPKESYSVSRGDEEDAPAYSWVDLPNSARRLDLAGDADSVRVPLGFSFPMYGNVFTETLVTSRGLLSFVEPFGILEPRRACLPDQYYYFYTVAPFRTALDLSKGGSIRVATFENRFVVSFEDVSLRDNSGRRFSFQTSLFPDGRIVFQYGHLDALPDDLAVGVQRNLAEFQELGCGVSAPVHTGLAVEFRPQTASTIWAIMDETALTVAPHGEVALPIHLRWTRPGAWPLQGSLRIHSDDPWAAVRHIPISLTAAQAPHERWFPVSANVNGPVAINAIMAP